MSVNTADANRAVLLHSGEYILIYCKNTSYEFSENESPEFKGAKSGYTYLTSHRIIFRNSREADLLSSLSIPFVTLRNVSLRANSVTGIVLAQPNGNFVGEVKFRLTFKNGGANEFIQALMIASWMAVQDGGNCEFPLKIPHYKPSKAWYEPSICAYQRPEGYFDWVPNHEVFTTPRPNSVYMTDNQPPYPGVRKPSVLDCWRFECEPFAKPSRSLRCPTSVHILEEPGQPVHGVYSFSPTDGSFPNTKLVSADGENDSKRSLVHFKIERESIVCTDTDTSCASSETTESSSYDSEQCIKFTDFSRTGEDQRTAPSESKGLKNLESIGIERFDNTVDETSSWSAVCVWSEQKTEKNMAKDTLEY